MAVDRDLRPVRPTIPARPGTTAGIGGDLVRVEAWDDEGHALVVDSRVGRLVRASDQPGFEDVHGSNLVAIIPGGGWLADHRPDPDAPEAGYVTPVAAWGLTAEGFIEPFVWHGPERIEEAREEYITIRHPDEREHRRPSTGFLS
ncbi:MAG: hypothetical protein ACRD2C_04150 [Acidimicrobiales bacterium]